MQLLPLRPLLHPLRSPLWRVRHPLQPLPILPLSPMRPIFSTTHLHHHKPFIILPLPPKESPPPPRIRLHPRTLLPPEISKLHRHADQPTPIESGWRKIGTCCACRTGREACVPPEGHVEEGRVGLGVPRSALGDAERPPGEGVFRGLVGEGVGEERAIGGEGGGIVFGHGGGGGSRGK
ncbi:hypothetical protein K461DRAFT_138056 [Myriangium duriaei CBS 260.36]|uniref:Uncharacterized protein n=1 Tax=Myriangium duriaei CBS 260.36 TaxID=1168546 RepID=A0A9P4MN11_9PEZI|nr:hypothetical protein K461DRAFT_138056 [Myriangium duriaei CBS 260.36]